jgi:hypothetical protein
MRLDGILFPEDREALKRLDEILTSRFLFGVLEATELTPAPDGEGWIESLPAGTFRDAAQKLRSLASQASGTDQQAVASQALLQLFDLYERSRA